MKTLAELERECHEHIFALIKASKRGLTRREIRAKRLPGAINSLQPLLAEGRIEKKDGRYVVKEADVQ